tara:strand:+ start:12346 stop:13920 length:1575 start_codon:yes stop_codon:yes gene_type:complete
VIVRKFPILGGATPKLIGRSNILNNIRASLSKNVPDHLQVVGARFSGKTVLLSALKSQLEQDNNSPYSAVLLWDLGHRTPQNDQEFLSQFTKKLAETIAEKYSDYAKHLESSIDTYYQDMSEVFQAINEETKILVILDGFDKALSNSQLTRNLWDQLRELAQNSSLRLITGSRKTLRELIRNPDAQTSDFWNIFLSTPVRVECFGEPEVAEIISKDCSLEYEKGALTELYNSTNGNPIILLEVLNYLLHHFNSNKIINANVQESINYAYQSVDDYLDALWHDCSPATQEIMRLIVERGEAQNVGKIDKQAILEKGFARATANKIANPSRILQHYLERRADEGSSIQRLFGDIDSYQSNFNNVIAKRIGQIPHFDNDLSRYLQRCIEDLPNHPSVCLGGIRGIINQVFELIWKAEFEGKPIPDGFFDTWRYNGEPSDIQDFKTSFPQGAKRLRLLKLLTGSEKSDSLAKFVSRPTYFAISAAYPFGDFGQHQERDEISLNMMYSALLVCVELVASLAIDFGCVND